MPTYTVPGVYVTESPLSALTQSTSGSSAAAFFGTAARGPITPTLISDWPTYQTTFGAIEDQYDLGYAVYHFFANGGRSCYVTRVVDDAATVSAALDANTEAHPWYPLGSGEASAPLMDITATSPGTWGNSVKVQTVAGTIAASASEFPTFTVVVSIGTKEMERWVDVSIDPASPRFVETVVNKYSSFIRVSNVNPDEDTPAVDAAIDSATVTTLVDGTDGTVEDSDYTAAFNKIDTISGNLLLNAPGVTTTAVVSALVSKAAARNDSFVIVDPDKTDADFASIQSTASNFSSAVPASYAAAYAPALIMVDPARSGATAVRATAPGGAIAGVYARLEASKTVAKAPAGLLDTSIAGAFGPSVKLTDTQIGQLYVGAVPVNSFKTVPGSGVTINGARTLAKGTPDKFIPVRRTLNYIKYSLKERLAYGAFEPNGSPLYDDLANNATQFLSAFWRAGGLKGDNASQAFYVICDDSNNTPGTVENGEVHVDVGVAVNTPGEFIIISLSQWSGGSNASESL